jgi:rhodanese-related sulfurtransferase
MKTILSILILGFFAVTVHGQNIQDKAYANRLKFLLAHNVKEISVKEAAALHGEAIFLDSRAKKEYDVSHIKGAKWIGYDEFNPNSLKNIAKDKQIIVYCSVGYRSEKITSKLNKLGYNNVSNLYGGIFEWVNQGEKVYDNQEVTTLKVHTYNEDWSKWLKRGVKIY